MAKSFRASKRATFEVEGSAELLAELRGLEADIAKSHLDEALLAGALVLQREMQRRAPRDRGVLAANLSVQRSGKASNLKVAYNVGAKKKAAHAIPVELGHNLVRILADGTKKIIGHVAAIPFMRNSYHAKKKEVVQAFADTLRARLERSRYVK